MKIEILTTTPKEIEICRAYWSLDQNGKFTQTVDQISKTLGVKTTDISKIISKGSQALSKSLACTNCKRPFSFKNRNEFNHGAPLPPWTCNACITEARQIAEAATRERIAAYVDHALNSPIEPSSLNARQIICLTALIRFGAYEDLSRIAPYSTLRTRRYSPDPDFDIQLLRELNSSRLVLVSPSSDISKISKTETGGFQFYIEEVELLLPNPDPLKFTESIEELITSSSFIEAYASELELFAKEIALQECIAFINLALADHRLKYSVGEKTILVLKKGLEKFSVAQMWNFIWRAAKDAAAFFVRERVSRDHAAKTVVGNIERQIDRAIANDWPVKPFARNYNLPQSALSMVLFNSVLGTDDGGVTSMVSELFRKPGPPTSSLPSQQEPE